MISKPKTIKELCALGLVTEMSSEDYHGLKGTYSSSQLKDLLENEEVFFDKYIGKTVEKQSIPAFDIGTYFHTAILEPEKLQLECAVWKGIRRGKEWDAFKVVNDGRAIITDSELGQAEGIIKAVKASPIAMGYLSKGKPEISVFIELTVYRRNIYSLKHSAVLGSFGWEPMTAPIPKDAGIKLILKARADLLGDDFILDLKSTTGNVKSANLLKGKVSSLNYDLSASLYLDLFSLALDKQLHKFIWTFASKDTFQSKSWVATITNVRVGRAKWRRAVLNLARCIENEWKFEDSLGELDPNYYELENLKESVEDIL